MDGTKTIGNMCLAKKSINLRYVLSNLRKTP